MRLGGSLSLGAEVGRGAADEHAAKHGLEERVEDDLGAAVKMR